MIARINFTKSINHDNVEHNIFFTLMKSWHYIICLVARDDLDISATGTQKIEFLSLLIVRKRQINYITL